MGQRMSSQLALYKRNLIRPALATLSKKVLLTALQQITRRC